MLRDRTNPSFASKTLHTQRLRLEPLEAAHARVLFPRLRPDASRESLSDGAPELIAAIGQRLRPLATGVSPGDRESWLNWALWSVPTGRCVGVVQARLYSHRSAHIAFVLLHEAWSDGYAREGAAALIDYLWSRWRLSDVWATVEVGNRRSIALLEGLGFVRMAVRANAEVIRGALADEFVYCLPLESPTYAFIT